MCLDLDLTGEEVVVTPALVRAVVVGGSWTETSIEVVVVVDGAMTTRDFGNETTPNDVGSVGPFGWLRGTKTIPKIPTRTNIRETAHQMFLVGRFSLRDFTSLILV